jgi:glycogen(starch) synthase
LTRVLILSWEYPPIIEGGLARHVHKLAGALGAAGVDVHVLTRGDEHSEPREQEREGVVVHRVRHPRRPDDLVAFLGWVERLNAALSAAGVRLADDHDFDVVHGHDWLVGVAGDHLARRFGAPFAVTIHATEYGRHQGWVSQHPQAYIHATERWLVGRAQALITCSHYMRGHVADVFNRPESAISVIPNGIDAPEFQPGIDLAALRSRFARPDEQLLLAVGRLSYEKGFQVALEALPALIRDVPGIRFVVAGSGPHEAALREQARRLGLLERGSFLGWIGDDLLHSLYRIADLCVVPSIYEPFGLVALEAMASGCPCIVADTGGLREVVPNDAVGLRFRSRDPHSLAQMMRRLLTDRPLRERLVAEASEHILRFDWAEIALATAAVYRAVLDGTALDADERAAPAVPGEPSLRSEASVAPRAS